MKTWTRPVAVVCAVTCALVAAGACTNKAEQAAQKDTTSLGASADLKTLMAARGLSEADVEAALKTYTPTGKKDEYFLFASGGHSGQVFVIGVPSMRQLKTIAVFTPEPWQGYGYGDESNKILRGRLGGNARAQLGRRAPPGAERDQGRLRRPVPVRERQGQRPHRRGRPAGLHDETDRRRIRSSAAITAARSSRPTPTTSSRVSQYPTPLGRDYAPLSDYKAKYRGFVMFWKFDRKKGRIVPEQSWGIELPPYSQDLSDAGKLEQRRLGVHQLVQHRDGHGRDAAGQARHRERRVAERHGLPARHRLEEGRAARRRRQDDDHQGLQGDLAADRRGRGRAHVRRRVQEPARLRRDARRHRHRRVGQARHAHDGLRLRQDQERSSRARRSRARTPSASRSWPSRTPSAGRSSSAWGRSTRSSTATATRTRACSSRARSPSGT